MLARYGAEIPEAPRNGLGRVDAWQRRHSPLAFVVAVWKKFGDDEGGKLVGQLTYRGFLSVFPLLLVIVREPDGDRLADGGLGVVRSPALSWLSATHTAALAAMLVA